MHLKEKNVLFKIVLGNNSFLLERLSLHVRIITIILIIMYTCIFSTNSIDTNINACLLPKTLIYLHFLETNVNDDVQYIQLY